VSSHFCRQRQCSVLHLRPGADGAASEGSAPRDEEQYAQENSLQDSHLAFQALLDKQLCRCEVQAPGAASYHRTCDRSQRQTGNASAASHIEPGSRLTSSPSISRLSGSVKYSLWLYPFALLLTVTVCALPTPNTEAGLVVVIEVLWLDTVLGHGVTKALKMGSNILRMMLVFALCSMRFHHLFLVVWMTH
jgi:hypothetical protein